MFIGCSFSYFRPVGVLLQQRVYNILPLYEETHIKNIGLNLKAWLLHWVTLKYGVSVN